MSSQPPKLTLRKKLQITGGVLLIVAASLAFWLFVIDFTWFLVGLGGIVSMGLIGAFMFSGKWPPLRE